eukprot:2547780-Rhodomonas_salina.1
MSGTAIAYGVISLRACYAMSGSEIACVLPVTGEKRRENKVPFPLLSYECAMQCLVLPKAMPDSYYPLADLSAYGLPTRSPVLRQAMLLGEERYPAGLGRRRVYELSLIHISEPTRPRLI